MEIVELRFLQVGKACRDWQQYSIVSITATQIDVPSQ